MKVLNLKFSFKRYFLDVVSVLQPVLFVVVCGPIQHAAVLGGEGMFEDLTGGKGLSVLFHVCSGFFVQF